MYCKHPIGLHNGRGVGVEITVWVCLISICKSVITGVGAGESNAVVPGMDHSKPGRVEVFILILRLAHIIQVDVVQIDERAASVDV